MQLRLKNKNDVRLFALTVTVVAMAGSFLLQRMMFPDNLLQNVLLQGEIITAMLALPISYFIGTKMHDVNDLTVQLEHAVNHDNLTGTATRLSFYHRLAQIEDLPLVMIVADIDHFKRVNDEYGHQAGDSALKQFANTLQRYCREEDVIARFGGEEFIILLQRANLEEGEQAAQRLCDRVREKTFVANGKRLRITASFGVAEVGSVSEVDDAIHRADLASFRAKRDGRDRVRCYDPELDKSPGRNRAAERKPARGKGR